MSKVYNIEMDDHQVRLIRDHLTSLNDFQMNVAQSEHLHPEVVKLVHDCLAIKRILKQIEIQYGQTTQKSRYADSLHEEET
jgi:UDP-N-acetylglucosamine transferase subunit ALG13